MKPSLAIPLALLTLAACEDPHRARKVSVPGHEGALKTTATLRADRRAFDGAPPVIPHGELGAACTSCHTVRGMAVPELGFAPPLPHGETSGLSDASRCTQCHVFRREESLYVASSFAGLRQDLRRGERQHDVAPPVVPHPIFMRENCAACHAGPAAREEIRTSHPDRENCRQCHVSAATELVFAR